MTDCVSIACSIVSALCAIGSLIAAILIGRCQVNQGKRMEALSLRQDEEVKRQKAQQLKAQRDTFLMKYFNEKDDIYLLPLCWSPHFITRLWRITGICSVNTTCWKKMFKMQFVTIWS